VNTAGEDAQREMEQRALRNVRVLLDKMEDQEQAERWTVRQFTVVFTITLVAAAIAIAVLVAFLKKPPGKAIIVPPPKSATR
jgi:hypothetical protein